MQGFEITPNMPTDLRIRLDGATDPETRKRGAVAFDKKYESEFLKGKLQVTVEGLLFENTKIGTYNKYGQTRRILEYQLRD